MRMTERLYLTRDKTRVVTENVREGRFNFCKPGDDIPDSLAIQYGLMDDPAAKVTVVQESAGVKAEAKAEVKKAKKAPNKKTEKAPNKKAEEKENKSGSGLTINRLKGTG